MNRPLLLALVALAASASVIQTASARDYYERHGEERREARREAIVAGAIRNKVATDRAEYHYEQCLRDSRYDEYCEQRLYEEEELARRKGRRTAIIVGR